MVVLQSQTLTQKARVCLHETIVMNVIVDKTVMAEIISA